MEGEGDRPLPMEEGSSGSTKMIAIVIVVILVIAAIAGAFYLMQDETKDLPTPSITADMEIIEAGQSVTFSVNFTDSDGLASKYIWYLGDENHVENTNNDSVTYTYDYPGNYLAILVIEDADGNQKGTWTAPVAVTVNNGVQEPAVDNIPFAFASATAQEIESDTEVSFNAESSWGWNGTNASQPPGTEYIEFLHWVYGDGVFNNGTFEAVAEANHTYVSDDNVLYGSYVDVIGTNGEDNRFYNTIIVAGGQQGDVKNPDTFVMASIGEPEYLDPAVDYETSGGEILQNVYETLVWYDGASAANLKGQLATEVPTMENGGITENGTVYTFHLRENVQFHNGEVMTSEDVKYSLERPLIINDGWSPAWILGQVLIENYVPDEELSQAQFDAAIWAVDDNTVQLNLTTAYPAFVYCMAYTVASVVSKKYVMDNGGTQFVGEDSTPGNDFMATHTCGTGPFQLNKWVANQYIQLDRFDDYWGGAADLKHVLLKKVQNVNTREMMIFSGDADCVYIPRQHADDVRGKDFLEITEELPTFNMDFIGFNQDINLTQAEALGIDMDVPATFFADKDVRLAMVSCFDYDSFIENIMQGTGEQPNGVIPKGMFAYPDTVPLYEFNLSAAAQYLENTSNPNEGGASYAETGFHLTFGYNAGNSVREAACLMFKSGLQALKTQGYIEGDITADVMALDWSGAYLPAVRNAALPVFFLGWAPDYADPDNYVNPFLHQDGTYANRCSIQNQTLTDMINDAAFELNETERAGIYYDISMEVYNNAYYCWTVQSTNFHVERTWVNGYYFNPMYSGLYYYALSK